MLATKNSTLITPYGEKLVDLMVPAESLEEIKAYAGRLPSIQISPRSLCDLELLATGAFSPLDRFMGQEDHQQVLGEMRLANGNLFPIPVALPVAANSELRLDSDIVLRNHEYEMMAIMTLEEIYEWDRTEVADKVFGTQDLRHPLVAEMHRWGPLNISGRIQVLQLPRHYDFQDLRLTPFQTRAKLAKIQRQNVIAVQPNSPTLQDLEQLTGQEIEDIDGIILLQLAVGMTKLGDFDYYTQVRTYRDLAERYGEPGRILLALLPLATRYAGPREALWRVLIQRNFGANHVVVGREQASPDKSPGSHSFYGSNETKELVAKYCHELGVKMVPSRVADNVSRPAPSTSFSTARVAKNGANSPIGKLQQEAADVLAKAHPPRHKQGVCIWFTGLSGSGKSTTAEILSWLLLEHGRRVVVLDGDVVRTHLSKGLGFSKEDRDTNVRRIGFVASELVRLGGVVICAVVSPYRAARHDVRNMVSQDHFVEVFVDTPLEVCEARDVKSIYAMARRGEITGLTGIDDPYEPPIQPEITLDTVDYEPEENATSIVDYLIGRGFIHIGQN
ncbi:MAG: adenylyl-sulfate kinase [Anaerolineaceae bacterium]|nr:MAG: adenylyl-sulfate kinase [Anaerolineaceae bacterium]